MKSICVFAGSGRGRRGEYAAAAECLGRELAVRGIRMVYGGGCVGLMGVAADAALAAGGEVIGVIPQALVDKELAHFGVSDLRVVHSMHERKAMMAELADAFVALPGGIGTLEELCEVLTWSQLGMHAKGVGLIDVCGYYHGLVEMLRHAAREGFFREEHLRLFVAAPDPIEVIEQLANYQPLVLPKWIDRETS